VLLTVVVSSVENRSSGEVADKRLPAGFFGPKMFTGGRRNLLGEGLARG
jgi:hypothetical protein